ncbi:MAG: alpha/beta hydrolase [Bacteroidetes bacterium]|nr:alpha/beta hydrolase [Bacteroidota bacterium]
MKTKQFVLVAVLALAQVAAWSQPVDRPSSGHVKTIVFIHGLFVTNNCWDEWKKYFEERGYTCYASAYPLKNESPLNLRKNIATGKIETLRFQNILEFYESEIKKIGGKPILIGHSLGGNLVQLLINKGLGSAGVCIHSGPPKGLISFKHSFLKSNLPLLRASTKKPYLMPYKNWQYAFTNGMTLSEQQATYDNYLVPESPQIAKDATTKITKVDFRKPHAPLLFTAGSTDHIIPASLNKRNYKKYKDKNSVTDFHLFQNRNHFVIGAAGWQEVAAYIEQWINKQNIQ